MSKRVYRVADGVNHVAGAKVPANRKVTLSEREALYDLSLGRITPVRAKQIKAVAPDENGGER